MIDRFIGIVLARRVLMAIIGVLALGYGVYALSKLTIEAYPELSPIEVQVTTQVPGLAAEEIEQQITTPLERQLANTPHLTSMRSSSTFGLSLITMLFDDSADNYFIRARVNERIQAASLPAAYQPSLDAVTGAAGEIYRYTLESDTKNLMELSELQRWVVIPALKQVPGVADVNNFGGFTKEFRLDLDPGQLQRYGVALNDVISAINNNNANAGGSRVARGDQSYVVRGIGQIRSLEQLGDVVVTSRDGVGITVADLGKLSYSHQEREGILGKDNNPDSIEGIVLLLLGENPSHVIQGIHQKVDELNQRLAIQGVRLVPYIDRDDLIQATIKKVSHTVLEGIGLVFLVLILFLGSPRSACVVAVTIPMALVSIFALMNATGMSANLFSLGAIDFGVIVDGAIVVTEAVLLWRERHPDSPMTTDDVRATMRQVSKPILFATVIIVSAYMPLFSFERVEAKLFSPMAYAIGFALFGALLCTLTLIPGLAYWAFRKPAKPFRNHPLEWLQRRYLAILKTLLRHPAIAYLISAGVLAAVVVLGLSVGREFLPDIDEGALWVQVQLPSGLSLDKASEMAGELRRTVREFPEVSYIVTQLGRSDDGTDPWTPSHIESPVGLRPYSTWPDGETKAQFVAKLTKRLNAMPGFSVGISQPIIDGVNDLVAGAHSPLAIKVVGLEFSELRRIGAEIVDVLKAVPGTADAEIFEEPPIPQVVIDIDRAAAARYGINIADIATLIQTGVGGAPVTQVYVGDRQYNVTVRFPEASRKNPDGLGDLMLNSSTGAQIPLSQLAHIHYATGESTIAHEASERDITIRIDLGNRDIASYLAEVQQKIGEEVKFDPTKYRLIYAGQFENQQRAQARLTVILGVLVGVMLVLLYLGLGTLRHALLTLGIVPMAMLGGLIALHLVGTTLNVATAVGFIALFGVAVQNGIIMVSNLNRVRESHLTLRAAVMEGASERFRPVLMTACVATLGMVPAALATGVGSDVQRGLATVVVGGLAIATLLTLFILPTFYFTIERFVERRRAEAVPDRKARR